MCFHFHSILKNEAITFKSTNVLVLRRGKEKISTVAFLLADPSLTALPLMEKWPSVCYRTTSRQGFTLQKWLGISESRCY